ncbi:MAG: IS110 family transposase [Actinobacteria bacterium]|nr:IS110 family transposase [Actinomycetota bacterium]
MQSVCINPYQVKKYRQAMGAKIKTDRVDALAVAELAKNKGAQKMFISSDEALNLKELVRVKHSFEDRVKRLKKSVLSMLSLVFPEYTGIIAHPFSKVSIEVLKNYPTAVHIATHASVSKLVKIFRKYQGCNFGYDKAKDLIDAAKDSFYSGKAYQTRGLTLSMQLDEISSLEAKIKIIENKLKEILAPKDSYPSDFDILNSIRGIGLGTIATFIACIGDVSRFSSSKKLISYIGLYPKIFESGKYKKKNPYIVKAGPKELRYMLYLSSVASIKHNGQLRKYYLDRVSAGMPGKKALIKVAVKIVKMMYSMLKSRSFYCDSRVFFQETPILVS